MVSGPTVVVRVADAGDVFTTWRWPSNHAAGGIGVAPAAEVTEVLAALAGAVPDLSRPDGVRHALTAGPFADVDAENELAQQLSRVFLPYGLAVQLHDAMTRGVRPHIAIQPSPRTAQVPWELIAPDPDIRLLDIADVSVAAPVSVVRAPNRHPRTWATTKRQPVVAVLDPRVPGFRADSALGSVLGRPDPAMPVARMVAAHAASGRICPRVLQPTDALRRTDLDREWLGSALRAGASRFVYVGHVTAAAPESGQSETAELHLACTSDAVGFAESVRSHRPLSAKDLLLGTHTLDANPVAGQEMWPMPSRVALIACESGGDMRFSEALGLVSAIIQSGAELVTATRWPLPTDFAFQQFAGAALDEHPLQDLVWAVDSAHESDDPVTALCDWQRARLARWRNGGAVVDSPVLWGALATVTT